MIKEFISKLWEKELKDYKFNSYGYSSSKINDGFYLILSKYTINKLENYAISKYKKGLKTDVKEKTNDNINHYKHTKINGVLDDKYIEYTSNRSENTSIELYLEKFRPHVGNMIDKLKKLGKWTIQSTMKVKLWFLCCYFLNVLVVYHHCLLMIQSKDNDDKHPIHSKSNNTEIMIDNETD